MGNYLRKGVNGSYFKHIFQHLSSYFTKNQLIDICELEFHCEYLMLISFEGIDFLRKQLKFLFLVYVCVCFYNWSNDANC